MQNKQQTELMSYKAIKNGDDGDVHKEQTLHFEGPV